MDRRLADRHKSCDLDPDMHLHGEEKGWRQVDKGLYRALTVTRPSHRYELGLLARGCAVDVEDQLALDCALEDREVVLDFEIPQPPAPS